MSQAKCKICGRALRNPDSVAKGMGPLCERRVIGIARGIVASRKAVRNCEPPECVGLLGKEDGEDGQTEG